MAGGRSASAQPAFFIEVIDNLCVVDIYTTAGDDGSGARLAGTTSVDIGRDVSIALPVDVYPHKATTDLLPPAESSTGARWVRIRAPIDRRSGKARSDDATRAIARIGRPASAAAIGELKDIQCRACGASIFGEDTQSAESPCSVRDLPSAHWSELVDCWMCHPEEDTLNVNPELMYTFEPDTEPATVPDGAVPACGPGPGVHMWVSSTFVLVPLACTRGLSARLVALGDKVSTSTAFSLSLHETDEARRASCLSTVAAGRCPRPTENTLCGVL
ncbi:hypothetical protein H4R19_003406 [Coemansia spiralis]|nr:hypothetical protein H4R19_003406 [Coemansia spiralis]